MNSRVNKISRNAHSFHCLSGRKTGDVGSGISDRDDRFLSRPAVVDRSLICTQGENDATNELCASYRLRCSMFYSFKSHR